MLVPLFFLKEIMILIRSSRYIQIKEGFFFLTLYFPLWEVLRASTKTVFFVKKNVAFQNIP